jgi:gliding motility-associated-like protein
MLNGQTTALDFFWTPSFSLSNDTLLNPIASPELTTTYTLTATIDGCMFNDYVTITLSDYLLFPNTFSPNGDGQNDVWEIVGVEKYPDCQVTIYDRWGQVVFEATGYNIDKAWDGQRRSGEIDESVYFYEVKLRDAQKQVFSGSITLIR